MVNVSMLSVIMLNVSMLSVSMLSVSILSVSMIVIIINGVILNIMPPFITLSPTYTLANLTQPSHWTANRKEKSDT